MTKKDADDAAPAAGESSKEPHGWIQWKGTNVCMDVHCSCGVMSHVDAEFAYFVRCPVCKQVFEVDGTVKLAPKNTHAPAHPSCLVEGRI